MALFSDTKHRGNHTVVDEKSPAAFLYKLCGCFLPEDNPNEIAKLYQYVCRLIGSRVEPSKVNDEFQVAERIKRKLVRDGRETDAARFSDLQRKFSSQALLKNRWSILYLLQNLSRSEKQVEDAVFLSGGLPGHVQSTPAALGNVMVTRSDLQQNDLDRSTTIVAPAIASMSSNSKTSSGIGSATSLANRSTISSFNATIDPSLVVQATGIRAQDEFSSGSNSRMDDISKQVVKSLVISHHERNNQSDRWAIPTRFKEQLLVKNDKVATRELSDKENTSFELSEAVLIRELIYAFQGINGKIIRFDQSVDGYRIESNIGVPKPNRELVHKHAEIGWLYRKIRKFVDQHSKDQAYGLVGQSFCAALNDELTEYYRLIAVLDAQREEQLSVSPANRNYLSLHRLSVWIFEPLQRLTILASLADVCTGKKGGALASAVHSYYQHGNPSIRNLVKTVLSKVVKPLNIMVNNWIFDGTLEDIHHEFFISFDSTVEEKRLWRKKYGITKAMLPSFMSVELAKKILLIGKSINFLRHTCQDRSTILGITDVKKAHTKEAEMSMQLMFTQKVAGSPLEVIIDSVYTATSKHLLKILNEKYKFMDHLRAMRRYLLLGQGDFVRHLMDFLAPDLDKSASNLYVHNLTGILETAIRATNAQYDDPDILKRLDIRLLEVSPGDSGWDIFSLDYHVDGPISTVFTAECMINYLRMFNFLWRLKRMEFVLGEIWCNLMKSFDEFKNLSDLLPLLHASNIMAAEMIHFVNQMQYYVMFEVLECAWDELVRNIEEANDLDDIIEAHDKFQKHIISRCLLDSASKELQAQIKSIFKYVLQFKSIQESIYEAARYELDSEKKLKVEAERRSKQGKWALTAADTEAEEQRMEEFISITIHSAREKLTKLKESSRVTIQAFLLALVSKVDVSLRCLCFRLDFNEFYREREPRLKSPMRLQRKKHTLLRA